ncbi:hypothetical protein GFH30_06310 [Acinetobacter wanghuae]|uniref:Uncharacterized protein n=1 Tax=Acinetobacter wanghuae TaxID=2662362 RepID=A0ABX6D4T2_9GAMM|nr:hypothetical protein [Acinetobacter wanghuae]QGA11027.1 hypothetical protein GFH30_06310 [Acinetobacter wanghuae]
MSNISIKKCINTGNWVEMCPTLHEVTTRGIAYFEQVAMHNGSFNTQRLLVAVGNNTRGRVQLDYCPFCGSDIQTKHDGGDK